MLSIGVAKNRISLIDLTKNFSENCGFVNGVIFEMNALIGKYREKVKESEDILSGKELIKMQSEGVSLMLKGLAVDYSKMLNYSSMLERKIDESILSGLESLIEDITPEPEIIESEEEETEGVEEDMEISAEEVETPVGEVATPTVDVPFTITNEVPEDSKPIEEQLSLAKEVCPSCKSFEREFPSFAFSIATGVGKTRLMGACIAYLYLKKGIRHFFILAPNLTIYEKLKRDFGEPSYEKYVFKGLAEFVTNPPLVVTADNYNSYQNNIIVVYIKFNKSI